MNSAVSWFTTPPSDDGLRLGEWRLKLGGFDLDYVSARLRAFAAEYTAGGAPQRYVVADDALVPESAVLANAPLVMRLIQRHRRLIVVELPFTATKIIVQSNIRILGLGPEGDRTVRIQVRANGSVHREVRSRRTIAAIRQRATPGAGPEAGIPAIVQIGPNWLVEEQVEGRHVGEPEMRRFVSTCLPAFYRHTARQRPYRGPAPLAALEAEAARCVPGFSLRGSPRLWPVALCKSDLNPTNILWAPGDRFWMIDWEFANVGAIATDIASICVRAPSLVDVTLGVLRDFSSADCYAPEVQLTLGFAWSLLHMEAERAAIAGQRRLHGVSEPDPAPQIAQTRNLMRAVFGAAPA